MIIGTFKTHIIHICVFFSGVGVGYNVVPGYAGGVVNYNSYGVGPSYGHTNLRSYGTTYATPLVNTVAGYGGGYGPVSYPAGYTYGSNGGFAYDTHVQHPTLYRGVNSVAYGGPVYGAAGHVH